MGGTFIAGGQDVSDRRLAGSRWTAQQEDRLSHMLTLPRVGAFEASRHASLRSRTRNSSACSTPIFSPASTASFPRNSSKNRMPSVS
jgi:hypothetical protein